MAQKKEQNKIPEKELNKMEIIKLSDKEFKILVVRMLKDLIEYGKSIREVGEVTGNRVRARQAPRSQTAVALSPL